MVVSGCYGGWFFVKSGWFRGNVDCKIVNFGFVVDFYYWIFIIDIFFVFFSLVWKCRWNFKVGFFERCVYLVWGLM